MAGIESKFKLVVTVGEAATSFKSSIVEIGDMSLVWDVAAAALNRWTFEVSSFSVTKVVSCNDEDKSLGVS